MSTYYLLTLVCWLCIAADLTSQINKLSASIMPNHLLLHSVNSRGEGPRMRWLHRRMLRFSLAVPQP